jgi:hypothetical protein
LFDREQIAIAGDLIDKACRVPALGVDGSVQIEQQAFRRGDLALIVLVDRVDGGEGACVMTDDLCSRKRAVAQCRKRSAEQGSKPAGSELDAEYAGSVFENRGKASCMNAMHMSTQCIDDQMDIRVRQGFARLCRMSAQVPANAPEMLDHVAQGVAGCDAGMVEYARSRFRSQDAACGTDLASLTHAHGTPARCRVFPITIDALIVQWANHQPPGIPVSTKLQLRNAFMFLVALAASAVTVASPPRESTTMHAKGTFDVKTTAQKADNADAEAAGFARIALDKQYHGAIDGIGKGEMLASGDGSKSGAYVALEKVSGSLDGRQGSFVLMHHAVMVDGAPRDWRVTVVRDSGTDELVGIAGELRILIASGTHSYEFEYTLP